MVSVSMSALLTLPILLIVKRSVIFPDRSTGSRSRQSVVPAVAAATAFFIMPSARRLTDRIVALIDGRR